ncbi:MAG TPA: Mut7-C RNAse domain-containing protein [Chthoniobacterales bacterium]|nr:Mut7-C RNAse domain-containing protein [Chthoniobacterales bacterium]
MSSFTIRLNFHGDLAFFLKSKAGNKLVERRLGEKTSVKDVIESCGVPHPEIDLILVNRQPVGFSHLLDREQEIDLYPVQSQSTLFYENRLQVHHLTKFLADCHLGRLARNLRLLGFDVVYDRDAQDRQLLAALNIDDPEIIGAREGSWSRALLTSDRRLLMHKIVRHGYCPRSQDPAEQIIEVMRRFDLVPLIAPFTRCLRCNALLEKVEKADVIEKLEPLTRIHYEQFRRCLGCRQIYWPGSHFAKLRARIEGIRATLAAESRSENQT